jgi:putative transposon-encoded protein
MVNVSNRLYTFHVYAIVVVPSRKAKRKIEEIETTASESGTGAHVFVPKEWLGKKVKVTLID